MNRYWLLISVVALIGYFISERARRSLLAFGVALSFMAGFMRLAINWSSNCGFWESVLVYCDRFDLDTAMGVVFYGIGIGLLCRLLHGLVSGEKT